jgi:NitT/TauT family transport system permease protein
MFRARVVGTQIAIVFVIIAAWDAAVAVGWIDAALLPPPATVAVTLSKLLRSAAFLENAADTFLRVVAAFAIGAPLALIVGFLMGENLTIGKSL